jgi:hypothetical protein
MSSIKDYQCGHGKLLTMPCDECTAVADMVNHPPHYKVGGIETIDYIQAKLTPEQFEGFCIGNALKYISRADHKEDATEDLHKAVWYLNRLLPLKVSKKGTNPPSE